MIKTLKVSKNTKAKSLAASIIYSLEDKNCFINICCIGKISTMIAVDALAIINTSFNDIKYSFQPHYESIRDKEGRIRTALIWEVKDIK